MKRFRFLCRPQSRPRPIKNEKKKKKKIALTACMIQTTLTSFDLFDLFLPWPSRRPNCFGYSKRIFAFRSMGTFSPSWKSSTAYLRKQKKKGGERERKSLTMGELNLITFRDSPWEKKMRERERDFKKKREGRRHFLRVGSGRQQSWMFHNWVSRAEVVQVLEKRKKKKGTYTHTFLMVKKRAPSAARHLLHVAYLWGLADSLLHVIFCFLFVPFFVSFPSPRMRMERKFLTPSPFLTIVLMLEDQTEKNIIRPASRNRPRLHLASVCWAFVLLCFAFCF